MIIEKNNKAQSLKFVLIKFVKREKEADKIIEINWIKHLEKINLRSIFRDNLKGQLELKTFKLSDNH